MIETALLAGVGTLVLTVVLGFLISLLFRSRDPEKQLRLGISASIVRPWLVGVYIVLLVVIWKILGRAG